MATENSSWRCTWRIDAGEDNARISGDDSTELLGDLFAMWLRDRGDVSEWDHAAVFGRIMLEYSDLTIAEIACWLGTDTKPILDAAPPRDDPPWTLPDPDGRSLTITRTRAE